MSVRRSTPRGQMTRGTNSGPAVMLMPPHIRATFMPPPPLKSIPPIKSRRKHPITGVFGYLDKFEKPSDTPVRKIQPTPEALKEEKKKKRAAQHQEALAPKIEAYRKEQRDCGGKFQGINCYNTLFVGRLAYEVTERKLLREMEAFGPVRDLKLVVEKEDENGNSNKNNNNSSHNTKSRGYAFVEYENEEDMKRAYRAADGMRIEGRQIVVDVERGHTVPTWLPRRLGGGLGGTRLGGKDKNVRAPGRFDPNRPPEPSRPPIMDGPPMMGGMGRGQGPPPGYGSGYGGGPYGGGGGGGGGYRDGPPPSYGGGGYGGPPSRGGGDRRRRRSRSRSSERGRYAPRPRY